MILEIKIQKLAPMIRYSKRIDGTYYIVEAVPETNKKKLEVVSAYKTKASQQTNDAVNSTTPVPDVQNASADNASAAAENVSDANIPRPHVQNEHSTTASIDSISQNEAVVNENLIKNISDSLKSDVRDTVIAALDKQYGGNGLRAFAQRLVSEYNTTGGIGNFAQSFSDGGAKAMSALSGETVQGTEALEQASDSAIDIDNIVNEAKEHAVGVIEDENTKTLSPQQLKTFDIIAKALGVRVKFVPDLGGENGFYKNGVVCIALNCEMKYTAVFSHEIVHRMKEMGAKTYQEFALLAVNVVSKRYGVKSSVYVSVLKKQYEKHGYKMNTPADVIEEIAADYAAELFDDVDALNEFISLTEDKKHIRNLFYKAVEMLKSILDKISPELTDNAFFEQFTGVEATARRLFEQMYGEAKGISTGQMSNQTWAGQENIKFSIAHTTDNERVVVINNDILKNKPKSEWVSIAKAAIEKFKPEIPVSGRLIIVTKKTQREYINSKYTERIKRNNRQIYMDKLNAAGHLDEIVLASTNYVNEDLKHVRKDSFKQFARGDVLMQIGKNKYKAKVIIGITSGNNMILYDLIDMQPVNFKIK